MADSSSHPAPTPPLKHIVFHALMVLIDGERHGYSIVKEVEARTAGELRIEPANLYRTLRTLLSQGLIEESDRRADPERDDERRRYFRITALGMDAARSEAARLERMLAAARSRNLLAESDSSR